MGPGRPHGTSPRAEGPREDNQKDESSRFFHTLVPKERAAVEFQAFDALMPDISRP